MLHLNSQITYTVFQSK